MITTLTKGARRALASGAPIERKDAPGGLQAIETAVTRVATEAKGRADATDAKLTPLEEKAGELDARVFGLEQKLSRTTHYGSAGRVETKETTGQLLAKSEELKEFLERGVRGRLAIEVKTLTSASIANLPDVQPGITPLGRRPLRVRDLFAPALPTNKGKVDFIRTTVVTNNAAAVAENPGAAKPQSDMATELVETPVRAIAHWMRMSKQIAADSDSLVAAVDDELRYGLAYAEELQLLLGDGSGVNLLGLYPQASAYALPAGLVMPSTPTKVDVLRAALLQSELAGYPSDGVVLNPTDWASIQLLKNTQGDYIAGSPQNGAPPELWNKNITTSLALTQGTFLVGAFQTAAQIWDRELASVLFSTEDQDNFVKNLLTALCEERLAFAVKRPQAFVKGTFTV